MESVYNKSDPSWLTLTEEGGVGTAELSSLSESSNMLSRSRMDGFNPSAENRSSSSLSSNYSKDTGKYIEYLGM